MLRARAGVSSHRVGAHQQRPRGTRRDRRARPPPVCYGRVRESAATAWAHISSDHMGHTHAGGDAQRELWGRVGSKRAAEHGMAAEQQLAMIEQLLCQAGSILGTHKGWSQDTLSAGCSYLFIASQRQTEAMRQLGQSV